MSLKRLECYTVVCDWPGCDADINAENFEYSGTDAATCMDDLRDSDWWTARGNDDRHDYGLTGGSHYCNEHPTAWASNEDHVIGMIPPYLLIHDGDTGNPNDDGRVSMVYDRDRMRCHRDGDTCAWAGCPNQFDDRPSTGCFLVGARKDDA